MHISKALIGISVLLLVAACSSDPDAESTAGRDTLTQRQRDSMVGRSSLPGAGTVRGALGASESAAARNARVDSVSQP